MKSWVDLYNAQPMEARKLGQLHEASLRIRHLKMEKARLLKRYRQSVDEINEHLKNCEAWLAKSIAEMEREEQQRQDVARVAQEGSL